MKKNIKKKYIILPILSIFLLAIIGIICYYVISLRPNILFNNSVEEKGLVYALDEHYPLSYEELDSLLPVNEEEVEKINSIPSFSEKDTWDIYLYMCGSDLESSFKDEMSDVNYYNVYMSQMENDPYQKDRDSYTEIATTLNENALDFPSSFYAPSPSVSNSEGETIYSEDMKGSASSDLRMITTTPLTPNVRFIIQTGGAKKWDYPGINPNRTQRFVYDHNGLKEVYNGPIENMGSETGLTSFLSFIQNYDADHKFFIFWNHGKGSFGAEIDEIFNDSLYLNEIRNSFEKFYDLSKTVPPFELLGFDACLMASTEAASILQGISNYYIASEDLEYGGWTYKEWIKALCDNPSMSGAMLGKHIVDSYIKTATQQYNSYSEQEVPNTLAVFDLSKAALVYDEYNALMERVLVDSISNPSVLKYVNASSAQSIRYASSDYENYNTCDLKIFMENLSPYYPQYCEKIINLLDDATLYSRGRAYNKSSKSLSISYPTSINDISSLFMCMDYINNVATKDSLKTLYYYVSVGCINNNGKDYLDSINMPYPLPLYNEQMNYIKSTLPLFNEDDSFSIHLPPYVEDYISSIRLVSAMYDKEEEKVTMLGKTVCPPLKDNMITAFYPETWLYMDENPLPLETIDKHDSLIRYKSFVNVNDKDTDIVVSYDTSNNDAVITGLKDSTLPSDTLSRYLVPLSSKDKITPLYKIKKGFYLEEDIEEGKSVKFKENKPLITRKTIEDGTYLFSIEVKSLRGDIYNSPLVEVIIENGKVKEEKINTSLILF